MHKGFWLLVILAIWVNGGCTSDSIQQPDAGADQADGSSPGDSGAEPDDSGRLKPDAGPTEDAGPDDAGTDAGLDAGADGGTDGGRDAGIDAGTDDAGPVDSDRDGVPDTGDAFPNDPAESSDADGDGVGDNADTDDDGDGVPDTGDAYPVNPYLCRDQDNDMCDDCALSGADGSGGRPRNDGLDSDADGSCDDGDTDDDGDRALDSTADNCLLVYNPAQIDQDGDSSGDACDSSACGALPCPRDCQGILDAGHADGDGEYAITPTIGSTSLLAYCDMTTDGGGFTLVLNYVHRGDTNPALQARTAQLPLSSGAALGTDESASRFWGHAAPSLLARLPASELRFTARTENHARVIDFINQDGGCISYFQTGIGDCLGQPGDHLPLPAHTANLPVSGDGGESDQGNFAMTEFPFYEDGAAYFGIAGDGDRWEADDFTDSDDFHTSHQIWVRSDGLAADCSDRLAVEPLAPDGIYYIDPDGFGAGEDGFPVHCDMTTDGGGWTRILQHGGAAYAINSAAVGDVAGGSTAFAKLADAQINALALVYADDVAPTYRITGNQTATKAFFESSGAFNDTAQSWGLFDGVLSVETCLSSDIATCTFAASSAAFFDTEAWGGSDDCTRFFTDYDGDVGCFPDTNPALRCVSSSATCQSPQVISALQMWMRPNQPDP